MNEDRYYKISMELKYRINEEYNRITDPNNKFFEVYECVGESFDRYIFLKTNRKSVMPSIRLNYFEYDGKFYTCYPTIIYYNGNFYDNIEELLCQGIVSLDFMEKSLGLHLEYEEE